MNWLPKDKVLVPVDFSEPSLDAVQTALQMVEDPIRLHVIHVLPRMHPMDPGYMWNELDDEERIEKATAALREKLVEHGAEGTQPHVCIGDAGKEVVDYAAKEGAELIVIPSHGYRGIRHAMLGSVAERVVRLAHCPVLVLRRSNSKG
jgi:nucleotide-binding universal stress UspA family protein